MRRKWHILVVSQDIGARMLATITFKRRSDHAEIVTSRDEAMPLIAQKLPDLIMIGLHLSDESGISLASDLRALHPQIPMLFIPSPTSHSLVSEKDILAADQLGIHILGRYRYEVMGGHNFNMALHKLLEHD